MSGTRKKREAQGAQKRETLWKRLFSVSTMGLVIALAALLVATLQWQQDSKTAESSDRAMATLIAVESDQVQVWKQLAGVVPYAQQAAPTATAIAAIIVNAESTLIAIERIERTARATLTPRSPEEALLQVEVYEDQDKSGTITQGDKLYVASALDLDFNKGQLVLDDVRALSSANVLGGRQYVLSGLTGVSEGFHDISAECGAIPRNLGGCVVVANPTPGGQDTIKLLIQPL